MIAKSGAGMLILAAVLFAGSFVGTAVTRSQTAASRPCPARGPLPKWLGLEAEEAAAIEAVDPQFSEDLLKSRGEVDDARAALIALFAKPDVTDDELRAQIDAVIDAHNRVEHRVADYLVSVRRYLTPAQQKRLFSLCADEVRQCRRRWQRGHCPACGAPRGTALRPGRGQGQGKGAGPGRGFGRGSGRP
jgi:Spy/CpxP family protein refolding chaperone